MDFLSFSFEHAIVSNQDLQKMAGVLLPAIKKLKAARTQKDFKHSDESINLPFDVQGLQRVRQLAEEKRA